MIKYVIEDIPPSNNQFIGRNNKWKYQAIKKEWAQLILFSCQPKPGEPLDKVELTIKYYFKDRRRRDPDNYSGKMILDGLVRADILKDDSFNNINLILKADIDKEQPRTEIYINEIK